MQALVDRSVKVELVRSSIRDPSDPVRVQVLFEPKRQFATTLSLQVAQKRSGGRWPFNLTLVATDPDPIDTIAITANLGETSALFAAGGGVACFG